MDYTENEKKGIDKVERMNRFFDRIFMPAIGILIIMLLLSFTVKKFRSKFGGGEEAPGQAATVTAQSEPEVFATRRELMADYQKYEKEFAAYGYLPVEGYAYDLSLRKQVDGEMSIFQFKGGALGELTIINYLPSDSGAPYDSLSLAISSHTLINVTVKRGEEKHTVTFTDTGFSAFKEEDAGEYDALMNDVRMEDIRAMYEIFEADIGNLARSCGIG